MFCLISRHQERQRLQLVAFGGAWRSVPELFNASKGSGQIGIGVNRFDVHQTVHPWNWE